MGGHRKIGRQKLRWSGVIRKYRKETGIKVGEEQDRRTSRMKTTTTRGSEKAEKEDDYEYIP